MYLSALHVYPVKSLRGIPLTEALVTPRGFLHDRRWMLVDGDGVFITQRELPELATIRTELTDTGLLLSHGKSTLLIPYEVHGPRLPVRVWKDETEAISTGAAAESWFQQQLGLDCRLVWMPDDVHRQVDLSYAQPGDSASFADGFPFLVIGQSSLNDLNDRLDEPVPMDRFRPNLVIEGAEPFAEDAWKRFRVGSVEFEVVKPCSRCVITTTDQQTGERRGPEPLRTLAQFRLVDGKVMFGQNIIARGEGVVRVGDSVEVLS